ncbi:hypothetical protein D3OALGA1CA_456 [Olavius algarvensis associated proteobacterium Delta 3]|nr:hypothetical protein D3OALGB2SA_482 [Olavius algarvensis associated proteobacterium Delta 3]CAB5084512.1 hypothetical protein D3OALGA1CA_456 [Olavius algarvensis associated proteobacterium Delta 3]
MLEKDKLRKADIFSGGIMALFGLWIISQGLKMPMKDSWGGVQNVWFVSPALFPLFVGAMITLLGVLLMRTALKTVGFNGFKRALGWLASPDLIRFLKSPATMRFYAIAGLFTCFVYIQVPRIDFFLCSVLFLFVFITMFYFADDELLKKFFLFYLGINAFFLMFFVFDLQTKLEPVMSQLAGWSAGFGIQTDLEPALAYPVDWITMAFTFVYFIYIGVAIRKTPELRKKFWISLVLSVVPPFLIGTIFKYFLLVPMPAEGLAVWLLDDIWYSYFQSWFS